MLIFDLQFMGTGRHGDSGHHVQRVVVVEKEVERGFATTLHLGMVETNAGGCRQKCLNAIYDGVPVKTFTLF